MARKGSSKSKFLHVTPDMMWDADEKKAQAEAEKKHREEMTVARPPKIDYAKAREEERRRRASEAARIRQEALHRYSCPFCGSLEREHECEGYKAELAKFQHIPREIRSGVPWAWAVEYYAKQGKIPPHPREYYE